MFKKKKNRRVEVIWADAHAQDGGSWVFLSDIRDRGEYLVSSIGFQLTKAEGAQSGHISIAQSLGIRDDAADSIIHIPWGMVREIYVLKGSAVDPKTLKRY